MSSPSTSRRSNTMRSRKLKRPTRLLLDYDGTLTVEDTMALFGKLPKQPTKFSWPQIVEAYMNDYQKFQDEKFPLQNYNRTEYSAWLASRRWVEEYSAQRVQDSGFFKGVKEEDIKTAVEQSMQTGNLKLRQGWNDLFELCLSSQNNGSSIEILSVNWSETAIQYALQIGAGNNVTLLSFLTTIPIHANEIQDLNAPLGSSGLIIRPNGADIRTNLDKVRHFSSSSDIFTVYIGDSSTDFDCLCAADLGIWLYDVPEGEYEEASKKTFAPLRYVPPRLSELQDVDLQGEKKELFYWAQNFGEVLDALTIASNTSLSVECW